MSKELLDTNSLATNFWDGLDKEDFKVPRVTIGQGLSTKGVPGKFNYNNGTSVDDMLSCKLLVPTKTRVLYRGRKSARCGSDNHYNPSPRFSNPPSTNCLVCPMSAWDSSPEKLAMIKELNNSKADPNKPLCTETYNLLMADANWSPFFIQFQKTQLNVVKEKLFSRIRSEFNGSPPFHVQFDMKIKQIQNDMNTYNTVVFENFSLCAEEDKAKGTQIYSSFKDKASTILSKEHEDMDRENDARGDDDEPLPF